jgi:hypothetical protein
VVVGETKAFFPYAGFSSSARMRKVSRYYFESFPIDRQRAEVVAVGTGLSTDRLVEQAIDLVSRDSRKGTPYGHVWCVFDRDSFPESNYARAFDLARTHRFHVAWSNETFELWYLLHFNYIGRGRDRGFPRPLSHARTHPASP